MGAEGGRGVGVGGEERLDGQFGDGDVERRATGGHGAEEGELAAGVADAERDDDVARAGQLDLRLRLIARVGS